MNLIDKFTTFSSGFYTIVLALSIPFYLLLYGASGHRFDPPAEDIVWMIIIFVSFIIMIAYLVVNKKRVWFITLIKIVLAITMVLTAYGAILFLKSMIDFKFGSDLGFMTRALFYLTPVLFCSCLR
jgi:hypothetical protein